jgi:hypothetical protein
VGSNIRMQQSRVQGTGPRSMSFVQKIIPDFSVEHSVTAAAYPDKMHVKSTWKNGDQMTNYSSSLTSPPRFPDLTPFHFFFWG